LAAEGDSWNPFAHRGLYWLAFVQLDIWRRTAGHVAAHRNHSALSAATMINSDYHLYKYFFFVLSFNLFGVVESRTSSPIDEESEKKMKKKNEKINKKIIVTI
jgi:hypothetical protein